MTPLIPMEAAVSVEQQQVGGLPHWADISTIPPVYVVASITLECRYAMKPNEPPTSISMQISDYKDRYTVNDR